MFAAIAGMSSLPPSSAPVSGSRRPRKNRLRAAQLRYPRSLFTLTDEALRELEAQGFRPGGRTLPPEELLVLMLEALELDGTERVLELGSPTAYPAALLSALARDVVSVADSEELARRRERELLALGCHNARVIHADAAGGWPTGAPYQGIVLAAGTTGVPVELVDQLDLGGRLVAPVGDADAQLLVRLHKRAAAVESETLGACHLGMLTGPVPTPSSFPWTHSVE